MIDANSIPPVAGHELLARFITQSKQFRASDQSVKPDLFIPFRQTELSVTRHRDATVEELWQFGREWRPCANGRFTAGRTSWRRTAR